MWLNLANCKRHFWCVEVASWNSIRHFDKKIIETLHRWFFVVCVVFFSFFKVYTVSGSSRLEASNNKWATARGSWFYFFFSFDGTYERPLEMPLAFSCALSVTSKIIIRKTYIKELLQINDIIILPHTQQTKKARDTDWLTDKVTYRVQQHKHNVQMHSVTKILA